MPMGVLYDGMIFNSHVDCVMTVTREILLVLVERGEKHWFSRYSPLFPASVECA